MKNFKEINKKVLIAVIVAIIVIVTSIVAIKIKQDKDYQENVPNVSFKKDNVFEYGSDQSNINLKDFVLTDENTKFETLTLERKIDTMLFGKNHLVKVIATNKGITKEFDLIYDVVDTKTPTIDGVKNYEITVGDSVDLLKDVKAKDEIDGNLKVELVGSYDVNKVDTYNLKVVAVDKNNNKTEKDFTLTVKAKPVETPTYDTSDSDDYYEDNYYDNSGYNNSSSSDDDSEDWLSAFQQGQLLSDGFYFYKAWSTTEECVANMKPMLAEHPSWTKCRCDFHFMEYKE